MTTHRMYLLTLDQVTALQRAGALGTHGPGAIEALGQDVSCGGCDNWIAYDPIRGKCKKFKQMTSQLMACSMWAAKKDQR